MEELVPEPEVWTARLRNLVDECIESPACDESDRIREALQLLQSGALVGTCDFVADPARVEAMLACGAPESAVLAMLSPQTVFMLSRGQGDSCLATVIAEPDGDEVIAEGSTLALALLAGYVAGVLSALDRSSNGLSAPFTEAIARLH